MSTGSVRATDPSRQAPGHPYLAPGLCSGRGRPCCSTCRCPRSRCRCCTAPGRCSSCRSSPVGRNLPWLGVPGGVRALPAPPRPHPHPAQASPRFCRQGAAGTPGSPPPEGLRVGEMGCRGRTPALVGDAPAGRARRSPDQRIPAPCQDGVQGLAAPGSPPPREQSTGSLRATGGCKGTGPPHLQWASCTPFHSRCCSRVRCPGSSHS